MRSALSLKPHARLTARGRRDALEAGDPRRGREGEGGRQSTRHLPSLLLPGCKPSCGMPEGCLYVDLQSRLLCCTDAFLVFFVRSDDRTDMGQKRVHLLRNRIWVAASGASEVVQGPHHKRRAVAVVCDERTRALSHPARRTWVGAARRARALASTTSWMFLLPSSMPNVPSHYPPRLVLAGPRTQRWNVSWTSLSKFCSRQSGTQMP